MKDFQISRLPVLYIESGSLRKLQSILNEPEIKYALIITGSESLKNSAHWRMLTGILENLSLDTVFFSIAGEPSPDDVDGITGTLKDRKPDIIIAVGGGSVIDSGKAVSAMLVSDGSVQDYLEGVGSRKPSGKKLPFIAVPTTAGTGSEATKNAVISRRGKGGFKKSLRHDNYVPDIAIIDPELHLSCPPRVSSASGLDALSQLIEAYVSTGANPFTDALAESGLAAVGRSFLRVVEQGDKDIDARMEMAYAAYLSGICLANAGLGLVHGIAGPAGAVYPLPHGAACAAFLFQSCSKTIEYLKSGGQEGAAALARYSRAGMLLGGKEHAEREEGLDMLMKTLSRFLKQAELPSLTEYGLTNEGADELAGMSVLKNHPADFDRETIRKIIVSSL
jgi:alcohol dehydrogenase class IV